MVHPREAKVTEGGVNNETAVIRHSQPYYSTTCALCTCKHPKQHVLFIDHVIFVLQAFKFEIRLKLDPTKNSNANPLLNVVLYFTEQP